MTMTRKQLKARRRHKAIVRERNIRTNNRSHNPFRILQRARHVFRIYNI